MPLRLRPDVRTTETDDGMVLLDERTGRYWQLNGTGAYVLHGLLAGATPDAVADELAVRYHIGQRHARADVAAVAERLRTAHLVVEL